MGRWTNPWIVGWRDGGTRIQVDWRTGRFYSLMDSMLASVDVDVAVAVAANTDAVSVPAAIHHSSFIL